MDSMVHQRNTHMHTAVSAGKIYKCVGVNRDPAKGLFFGTVHLCLLRYVHGADVHRLQPVRHEHA